MHPAKILFTSLLLTATTLYAAAPDLAESRKLAQAYDEYTHPTGEGTWEKTAALPTAKKADEAQWKPDGGEISIDKDGLKLVAPAGAGGYVASTQKTTGPVAIRYEAMTPEGSEPCDLSVRFKQPDGNILAFAFGGYANNENFFYLGKKRLVVGKEPKITPGQWYTVEVFITPENISAKVDGKLVGETPLPSRISPDTQHEISLYVWATTGIFKNVQLLKYIPPRPDTRTWEQAVGKSTEADLKALAEKTAPLLGHDNFSTREAAEEILFHLRPLSDDTVRQQLKNPDPEIATRPQKLAARMKLPEATPAQSQPKSTQ